ncbi:MAG TPA: threonine-phosphate decarboxylase [Bacteroidales bacterium]|nr:threonine-phosphate decarboxylase [Bacteroidales bacterium]
MLNGHGDDIQYHVAANFSSNVFYGGAQEELIAHLSASLYKINRYPEVIATSLRESIAAHHQVSPQQVIPVNGAIEAIYLIAQAFPEGNTTLFYPSFSEYEDACKLYHHTINFLPFESLLQAPVFNSRLVFICNPNNPTGTALEREKMRQMIKANPGTIFVIDEAYEAFTNKETSCMPLLEELNNLIVIKSLTKQFSIPGLRLGYIVSHSQLIDKLLLYKMPWTVNALAIEAGLFIVKNLISKPFPVKELITETAWLTNRISSMAEIVVFPSDTSFFLCKLKQGNAAELKDYLINRHGILIRDASNFRGLSAGYFRIATQRRTHNEGLIKALQQWTTQVS